MLHRILFSCVISCLFGQHLIAQLPDFGPVFLQNEVATVRISIDPDSLAALLASENAGTEREFPANFKYESSVLTDSMSAIGFRLRGNTSLNSAKQSFKISFNTYSSSRWQGLEKLNLNGSANDPSMIRAKLCWDIIRDADLPGSRTSFVKLFINGEYRGLYSNIEHIDENFADTYFPGSMYSSQYKCLYPAPLDYRSSGYNYEEFGRRPYDLTINDYTENYTELSQFIFQLNQALLANLPCTLERIFDVDSYLRYAALDVLMGNWDGYAYNKNNFYLQKDYHTGQFHFLPYDLDNTLGIDWVGQNWTTRNVMNWAPNSETRPLYKRLILQVPEYSARYQQYIREFSQDIFHPDSIAAKAQQYINLISPAVINDPYHSLDYGFTYEDFQNSVTTAWGGHVAYSINEYAALRVASALAQTSASNQTAQVTGGWINHAHTLAYAHVNGASTGVMEVQIGFNPTLPSPDYVFLLKDDGIFPDQIAGDGWMTAALNYLPGQPANSFVYYRFSYTPAGETTAQLWPCTSRVHYDSPETQGGQPVNLINEVMSANTNVIQDTAGQYSDWLEVYNPFPTAFSTTDYYLTNDTNYLNKWPLPELNIPANGFHLLWANSDEELSRNNINFKLSAGGEFLRLSHRMDDFYRTVAEVNIPALSTNASYGHPIDGDSNWVVFIPGTTTPEASNYHVGISSVTPDVFHLFPNPARECIFINREAVTVSVYDSSGRRVIQKHNTQSIPLSDIEAGAYLIHLTDAKSSTQIKFIKL